MKMIKLSDIHPVYTEEQDSVAYFRQLISAMLKANDSEENDTAWSDLINIMVRVNSVPPRTHIITWSLLQGLTEAQFHFIEILSHLVEGAIEGGHCKCKISNAIELMGAAKAYQFISSQSERDAFSALLNKLLEAVIDLPETATKSDIDAKLLGQLDK